MKDAIRRHVGEDHGEFAEMMSCADAHCAGFAPSQRVRLWGDFQTYLNDLNINLIIYINNVIQVFA